MSKDKTFIIAELSANHNNNFELAKKTIEAMAKAGADAVKVQTFKADSLTMNVDNQYFGPKKDGPWKGLRPYDVFEEGAMPYEWQPRLQELAENLNMVFFSSPFDFEGVDFLESLNVPIYKIASFEITDVNLIRYAASKGKPMIISTGVAELEDIKLAIDICRKEGNNDITILKCTSQYPATSSDANLKTMVKIKNEFDVKIGLSDHTMGSTVPMVAVALGATVVEKHFILDRNQGGPDAHFSMEPKEFEIMVKNIREVESSLGKETFEVKDSDKLRRRSLFSSIDIAKGDVISLDNIKSVRPGYGLHPKYLNEIIGKIAVQNIPIGMPLKISYFKKLL